MIFCNFANQDDKNEFLQSTRLPENTDGSVTIPLSLITLARKKNGTVSTDDSVNTYIVKTNDPSCISTPNCQVSTTYGDNGLLVANSENYYVIETTNGLSLFDEFNGEVEQVNTPVTLMSSFSGTIVDTLPEGYDWPRLRIVSRGRPLVDKFVLADTNFKTKPNVVIMDSGINAGHIELTGLSIENLFALPAFEDDYIDDSGHGTAVTSFVSGATTGLHRHLNLLNCKVFSKTYKPNAIELGQAFDACYTRFAQDTSVPMVINCSWVVPKNSYLESKIQELIEAGISIVCASGNTGITVDLLTPAGMLDVVTVGATDIDDCGAGFNNFSEVELPITTNDGENIDIFAPGVDVYGAHYSSDSSYCKYSGTSVSSGFVTGCVAAILALIDGTYNATAKKILLDYSNLGQLLLDIDKYSLEQNRLAYLINSENHPAVDTLSYYLGAFSDEVLLLSGTPDILLNTSLYTQVTDATFGISVEWGNEATEQELENCMTLNEVTGEFVISNPNIVWKADEKLRLISFRLKANALDNSIAFSSPNIIFFATNPAVQESLTGDISTALENIDNQSFYAAWVNLQSIK